MHPVITDPCRRMDFVLINAELAIASTDRHRLSYTSHKMYVPLDIFDVRIILVPSSETSNKLSTYFVPVLRDYDGRIAEGMALDPVRASQETIDFNSTYGDVAAVKLLAKFRQEAQEATPDKDLHVRIRAVGMPLGVHKHPVLRDRVRNAILKHKAELADDLAKKLNALNAALSKLQAVKTTNTP